MHVIKYNIRTMLKSFIVPISLHSNIQRADMLGDVVSITFNILNM